MVGSCHTHFYRPHRHTTFAAPQTQLKSITQIKEKFNQQVKFNNIKLYLKLGLLLFLFFPPYGKRVPGSKYRQTKVVEHKAVEIIGTTVQNTYKQA